MIASLSLGLRAPYEHSTIGLTKNFSSSLIQYHGREVTIGYCSKQIPFWREATWMTIMPAVDLSEYLDGLYRYAFVLSRNSTEAEDLVQETCLRALRATQRLRPDSNVKSWLFTILRNIWFNQLRQWRRAPEIVELESDRTGPVSVADRAKDPHASYVNNIEQEQVRNAIQQLSIEHRAIIILREYDELSYREIATVLECPLGTVMSRLASARSKLRDLLFPMSVALRSAKRVTIDAETTGT